MSTFEPTFDSLRSYECPDWFRDAKFGIWSHWGPQSVPMYGDWYARHMYLEGHAQYLYHIRHYGHPSEFGYKDICTLWKAEAFDPAELMALYKKAGARYFVAQATHHDHFFNFPSKLNRFNSMQVGPGKDICGLWKAAADEQGLPFGLTEHLGAAFSWWRFNKGADTSGPYAGVPYDGNDPEYRDFYFDNYEHVGGDSKNTQARPWYTTNAAFRQYWLDVVKEMVDLYEPDLLYSDGALPFGVNHESTPGDADFAAGLDAVAHFYNTSIRKHGVNRAVYNQKDRRPEVYRVGVLDIEKSQLPGINPEPWQTDTCIGNWFYDVRQGFKKPDHVIEMLVDIVAKNGCLLLNILQRPDGAIDAESRYLLEELSNWFPVCGEGIHGTRPWRQFGEGDSRSSTEGFKEDKIAWNSADIRFTTKGNTLYAFLLKTPENRIAVVKSLTEADKVSSVRLLGAGECAFSQAFGTLTVKLPDDLATSYTQCLAIELAG
ncbi:MAG: alpha-L-fucosidase [Lentisphaerae bacterium]|jgi:alpha-L-fucosidase|nr:alpha-L-fucosidase [Lentisphaerota bacterium]MBT4819647.1 alpha-L-fucosidase [Lentisphaerota bacterium]MBT5608923.1 alpha-L-fucosidase [Lentisphaerota bacterium]MBT7055582.1 alpha-L-fucosidase [Lentisphaerota bacterium]MBT7845541.1 alpha-L-fucosidase [Lentisphaerota bacterium]